MTNRRHERKTDFSEGLEKTVDQENPVQSEMALNYDPTLIEEISRLAYQFYLERASTGQGSPEEDWYRAEREVLARRAAGEI